MATYLVKLESPFGICGISGFGLIVDVMFAESDGCVDVGFFFFGFAILSFFKKEKETIMMS